MNDEVPDLSAGPKINELSHAALAAVQIASSRRDAAERADAEALREAESRVAELQRARAEWRRLTDVTGRAGDQLAEARFETTLTSSTAAVSRQRHDGAIFDYHEAIEAPAGSVPRWRLDALERAVGETGRQSERDDALAVRAADRHQRAAVRYGDADAALREFEREHSITRDAVPRSEPPWVTRDSTTLGFAAATDALIAADQHDADVWAEVRADAASTDDVAVTTVDEREVGREHAVTAAGKQNAKLASAEAAAAVAGARGVAFPTLIRDGTVMGSEHLGAASAGRQQTRGTR